MNSHSPNIEQLLRNEFLHLDFDRPENEMLLEEIADYCFNTPGTYAPSPNTSVIKQLFLKYGLYLSAVALVVAVSIFGLSKKANPSFVSGKKTKPGTELNSEKVFNNNIRISDQSSTSSSVPVAESIPSIKAQPIATITHEEIICPQPTPFYLPYKYVPVKNHQDEYLPHLTPEEIKANEKQKKKMIDRLLKADKREWAYIPSGSMAFRGESFSVQTFYMAVTEVTNLSYRTFLFDLLIHNRIDEFHRAKPHQSLWIERFRWSFNEPMKENYFSHPAYDHYPVVNITREGAEIYCEWLSEEAATAVKKNSKVRFPKVRIPFETEWVYAAKGKNNVAIYANGKDTLQNEAGCYLANFTCYKLKEATYDSTTHLWVSGSGGEMHLNEDGGFHTVNVSSYLANDFGLYCMAGNVSEMVWDQQRTSMITKGGSWFSLDYYLRIDANEEYMFEKNNASPMIGFRPVFTFMQNN